MKEPWQTVLAIIGSIGGAGFIIGVIIRFFADNIAERLHEKYKTENSIELEKMKGEVNSELEKLKAANARVNHIMISLYDEEQKVLKDLIISMGEVGGSINALALYAVRGQSVNNILIAQELNEKINSLVRNITIGSIYINENLYNKFNEFRITSQKITQKVEEIGSIDLNLRKNLLELSENITDDIRKEIAIKKKKYLETTPNDQP